MNLRKEDFYSGSFLSFLLNNGIVPALFEGRKDNGRKIYDFSTNSDEFRVYVKYSEKPSSTNKHRKSSIWNFHFTTAQIDELKDINDPYRKLFFVFICGNEKLNNSKLAVIDNDIIFQCIDVNRMDKYKGQSVKIKLIKNHRNFNIYGTTRNDKIDGEDSTFKVRTNNIGVSFGLDNAQ